MRARVTAGPEGDWACAIGLQGKEPLKPKQNVWVLSLWALMLMPQALHSAGASAASEGETVNSETSNFNRISMLLVFLAGCSL